MKLSRRRFVFASALVIFVILSVIIVKFFLSSSAAPRRLKTGVSAKDSSIAPAQSELEIIKKAVKEKKYLETETLLKEFLKAKHSKEEKYEARFTLGYVYLSLGRNRLALREFELVSYASPPHKRSPDATYMAAVMWEQKFSDREKSRKYYDKYVRVWPQGRLARRALKKLERN
ncbi:hypothetical protein KJ633_04200 [bacterium]|nr:hypothetical protein [bacterium]MBU3955641.1 hypothetical protein [bacterium]